MSKLSFALASAVLCSALPVHAQQKPVNLPDGPGKDAVATSCSGCHGLSRVAASGYADFARGYLGRLDPATGEVSEWQSPSGPRSQPYGIVATKGAIWYNESGTKPNTIVRFDPKTQQFQSWVIPSGGYIVRKMDVTPDGNPVMANSTVNFVGMVEVK